MITEIASEYAQTIYHLTGKSSGKIGIEALGYDSEKGFRQILEKETGKKIYGFETLQKKKGVELTYLTPPYNMSPTIAYRIRM